MRKTTVALFGMFLVLAIAFQLWMEAHSRFDSLGLWYTLYCSTINAIILTAVFVVIGYPIKWYLRYRRQRKDVQ